MNDGFNIFVAIFCLVMLAACATHYRSLNGLTGSEAEIALAESDVRCIGYARYMAAPVPNDLTHRDATERRQALSRYYMLFGRYYANCMTAEGWIAE